jgi:hypothetical protein
MWINTLFGCPSQIVRKDDIEMKFVLCFGVGNSLLNFFQAFTYTVRI